VSTSRVGTMPKFTALSTFRSEPGKTLSPYLQATLRKPFSHFGVGLHSGRVTRVTIHPGAPNTGYLVSRIQRGAIEEVPATWTNYVPQYMCTGIQSRSGAVIRTVEHLLASLSAFGIDNARIDIEGEELPILDGSALPWCHSILEAGLAEQDEPRRYLRIMRPVELVEDPGRWLRIEPAETFSLRITSDPPGFGLLTWDGEPSPERFLREIAPSRSHGPLIGYFAKLFFALTGQSRLRGVNFQTVAFTVRGHYLGGMRIPDEPVRHRVLDLLGDLALSGMPLLGRVTGHGTSHRLNNMFLRTLMESTDAWQEITLSGDQHSA